ncbi:MAG: NlpC/P60 family protein [Clostridium sp.]
MMKSSEILILSCACILMSGIGNMSSAAAIDLETDAPMAGVSVAFNNYYAGSLNPEEELVQAFSSKSKKADKAVKETAAPKVKATEAAKSPYENVAISKVTNYVNVRSEANTTSSVAGKLYNNCAATILSTVDGEGGKWYQIQSGTVKGYIKAQYFITGSDAEAIARKVGTSFARVANTSTLRLREQPNLDSKTLDLLSPDAEYEVVGEEGDFAKIAVDTDLVGYVFKEYINIRVEFNKAVSLEEEAAKNAETEKLKQEADAAIKNLEAAKKSAEKQQAAAGTTVAKVPTTTKVPDTSFSGTIEANPDGTTKAPESTKAPTKAPTTAPTVPEPTKGNTSGGPGVGSNGGFSGPGGGFSGPGGAEVVSATRSAIVAYAKQFLGNPYVYGGTSLTNGTDCSGFTQGVYAHFGITTGRTSRDQAAKGQEISIGNVQPGDLLFYASGNYINHVAMYIGGGQVIHASTSSTGIIISPSNYRTACKAVSFLN